VLGCGRAAPEPQSLKSEHAQLLALLRGCPAALVDPLL
jgi:hypothetical protein